MAQRRRRVGFGEASEAPAALFVRIPRAEAEKLDRAAFELKRPKQEIVASLIARYVDPQAPSWPPLELDSEDLPVGRHSFRAVAPPEVLTPDELASLLRADLELVVGLAERGELPGRRIGDEWRFSRRAVLDWLGTPD